MTRDKLQTVQATINIYKRLLPIAKQLNNLDTIECNRGELTKSQQTRTKNLMIQASELASNLDLFVYHQEDPRGCSLYLVKSLENVASHYNNGIAII